MSNRYTKPQQVFRAWQRRGTGKERTTAVVATAMGDSGSALRVWATGNRATLPLESVADLARVTWINIEQLCSPDQRRILRKLEQVMRREEMDGSRS